MPTFPNNISPDSRPLIHQLVNQVADAHPDGIAAVFGDQSLTYGQLTGRANTLAKQLAQTGRNAACVGISTTRGLDMIVGLLAILKAEKAYLPLDPAFPEQRLQQIVSDSRLQTCVAESAGAAAFGKLGLSVVSATDAVEETNPPAEPGNLAYVLYTSGSTGKPKGVCMGHGPLLNLLTWQAGQSAAGVGTRTLQLAPLGFDVSFQEIFATLTTGGTLVLVDEATRMDFGALLALIEGQAVNRLFLPFVALQYLAELAVSARRFPTALREVMTAGEPLKITPQVAEFFANLPGCTLFNQYGPTECHVVTQLTLTGAPATWPALPTIGAPIDNVQVWVVDETLTILPKGETGELCLGGACLAEGYLNRPDLTAEKFTCLTTATGDRQPVYRTGDLGRYRVDGTIEFLGRRDDQVKIRGHRVELSEVEVALSQTPGVRQAVVVAREGAGGRQIIAYVVAADGLTDRSAVRTTLAGRLPDYMLPSAFVWLDDLPRTSSGKVDKKRLPAPGRHRPDLGIPFRKPRTNLEQKLARVWGEVLQLDQVGADDNFFELGGNSLLAQRTVATLKQAGHTLPITKLYQFPTPAATARYLTNPAPGADSSIRSAAVPGRPASSDIAIIGMAGRFPGANTITELWGLLRQGRESVRFFQDDELDPAVSALLKADPLYVKARGVIDGADEFDPAFFGLTPSQARLMDPQQRIFLEIAYEALEQTGYLPQQYGGRVGVFAGTGTNTYYLRNVLANRELVAATSGQFQVDLLNEKDYVATRTAYSLDLKGPAVSVFSACSTSLLAIAQAVQSLRSGQCEVALAGGVSITAPLNSGHLYQEGAMLSRDGRTRPFNAGSTGTVFSDGAGIVLLKSAEAARRDGDTIWAIIEGVGINNDGAGKGSFSAPNADGQAAAIRAAHADAGVDPADISYVEAHGTATPIGDPIEIEGLTMAFGEQAGRQFCAIGSVKSNFGHLTAAAGVAGLIKTTLALHHRQLPASLGFEQPNPAIDFANSPFFVNAQLADWPGERLRRAGVSSFGIGGTNVHVVLREADEQPTARPDEADQPAQLITWSAKTAESALAYAEKLAEAGRADSTLRPTDVAHTLHTTRPDFAHRRFVVAQTTAELLEQLSNPAGMPPVPPVQQVPGEVVFLFPGQGSQYLNMARPLYDNEPVFRRAVDECAGLLTPYLDRDIRTVLYSERPDAGAEARLNDTRYTQPALFVTEYALARLWMHRGIRPTVLCGHSIGEFVAAHLAGVFSLTDALRVVTTRGRLVSEQPRGLMLSVRRDADAVRTLLPDTLSIAAVNSRNLCVVAGPNDAVANFARQLSEHDIPNKLLPTSHAFHSAMMDPVADALANVVAGVTLNRPLKPIVSTLTGTLLTDAQAIDPHYWARHLRETVQFAGALDTLLAFDNPLLFDVGPGRVSATLARQQAAGKPVAILMGLDNAPDWPTAHRSLLNTLGQLWQRGLSPDWDTLYAGQSPKRVLLPTYAFDRQRYWVDSPAPTPPHPVRAVPPTPESTITTESVSVTPIFTPVASMRKPLLLNRINQLLEEASGIDLNGTQPTTTFIEIGLDSLSTLR